MMTKAELKRRLQARDQPCTDRAIADIFGIKYQAVQQWGRNLPKARYYELIVKRPELVNGSAK